MNTQTKSPGRNMDKIILACELSLATIKRLDELPQRYQEEFFSSTNNYKSLVFIGLNGFGRPDTHPNAHFSCESPAGLINNKDSYLMRCKDDLMNMSLKAGSSEDELNKAIKEMNTALSVFRNSYNFAQKKILAKEKINLNYSQDVFPTNYKRFFTAQFKPEYRRELRFILGYLKGIDNVCVKYGL